jgi:hypothetical protein
MSLTNNGAGTVTIGVLPVTASLSGNGLISSSQQITNFGFTSASLSIRKDLSVVSGIQSITLTGSIFLDSSGSNGAFLRVDAGGAPVLLNGVVSSSQQIEDYDVFAVKDSANRFVGNQEITGSLISTATITTNDLFVANSPNFAVPQGNVIIGGTDSRIAFLPTASLTTTAAIGVVDGFATSFSNISTVKFTTDFAVNSSGSGVVVISSVSGSGGTLSSGSGFPFSGSAVITGSLTTTGPVTASAFAITSVGTPEIESATNINLTAGNAVIVTSSPLRLASYTNAQTGSITAQNGDIIYNSTTNKFMGREGSNWVEFTSGSSIIGGGGSIETGSFATTASFNTFTSSYNSGSFSGSFVGDGSGLTGLPAVSSINTGSFAVTGSNIFRGNQIISGSVTITGSISQVGVGTNIIITLTPPASRTTATQNVIIGPFAGNGITTGFGNTYIGNGTGQSNQTGNNQTFIGRDAGRVNTANENTFVGSLSGYFNTTGTGNSFFGYYAGYNNTASNNTFIGDEAGFSNTSGNNNTFVGQRAGNLNTTAQHNTFVGSSAGQLNISGNYNTFIGKEAGSLNTTGTLNTFIGYEAGYSNNTAGQNTFVGGNSGFNNSVGTYNTFVGVSAGYYNTSGSNNTFVGTSAGSDNTTGAQNSYFGLNSGNSNSVGNHNSSFGYSAGSSSVSGSNNSFFGSMVASGMTSGSGNTFIGYQAARIISGSGVLSSADNSICLGYLARLSQNNETNQIVIGFNTIGNGSNTVTIGNSSITATHLRGNTIITGSVSVTEVIRLSAVNPLPVSATAGTLAVSSSGAVVKPYFFDGSVWNELY